MLDIPLAFPITAYRKKTKAIKNVDNDKSNNDKEKNILTIVRRMIELFHIHQKKT